MNADPLDALKDIHLPLEPHWWPPALGWWITAGLALISLLWLLRRWWAYHTATRPIRAAKRIVDALAEEDASSSLSDVTVVNQCNEVLKRLLVVALDMRTLGNQSGSQWLCALDRLSNTRDFTQGPGSALGEDRFKADVRLDRRGLLVCVKHLLTKVHHRKSKALIEESV